VIRVALIVLALSLAAASAGAEARFDPFRLAGVDARADARVALATQVTDEAGRTTSLADLGRGQPLLLAPVQHRCPNICGFTLDGLAAAVRGQGLRPGRDFQVVAFGFDPREGPADARATALRLSRALGGPAGVHAVVATPAAIRQVLGGLGYRYAWDPRLGQYAHVAATAVLAPDGRLARWIYGITPQPGELRRAVADAQRRRVDLGEQLLLLCYHYAPQTGRYAGAVQAAVRIGGGVTALALAGLIAVALRREARRGRERPS
jgi:protein SCO1/2